jgi:hypothetical protein
MRSSRRPLPRGKIGRQLKRQERPLLEGYYRESDQGRVGTTIEQGRKEGRIDRTAASAVL